MEISYKGTWGNSNKEMSFENIIDNSIYDSNEYLNQGKLEKIEQKVAYTIKLTEKVVEVLYKKGIFNDIDMKDIVECISYKGLDRKEEFKVHTED